MADPSCKKKPTIPGKKRVPAAFKTYFFKDENIVDGEKFYLRAPNNPRIIVRNPVENLAALIPYIPTIGNGVYVGVSTIPNGGFGLFAGRDFLEGEIISYYHGIYLVDHDSTWVNADLVPRAATHALGLLHEEYVLLGNFMLEERGVKMVELPQIELEGKGGIAFGNTLAEESGSSKEDIEAREEEDVDSLDSGEEVTINGRLRTIFSADFLNRFTCRQATGEFVYESDIPFTPEDILIVAVAIKSIRQYEEVFYNYNYQSDEVLKEAMAPTTGDQGPVLSPSRETLELGLTSEIRFNIYQFGQTSPAISNLFTTNMRTAEERETLMRDYRGIAKLHAQGNSYQSLIGSMTERSNVLRYFTIELEHEKNQLEEAQLEGEGTKKNETLSSKINVKVAMRIGSLLSGMRKLNL